MEQLIAARDGPVEDTRYKIEIALAAKTKERKVLLMNWLAIWLDGHCLSYWRLDAENPTENQDRTKMIVSFENSYDALEFKLSTEYNRLVEFNSSLSRYQNTQFAY